MTRKLVVLLLVLALPLSAQQLSETIEVAITSVDVVVTDAKGKRIRGLTKADFEILENGKPREITNFTEYLATAPELSNATAVIPGGTTQVTQVGPPPARRLLILFDSNSLNPALRRQGAAAAIKFVEKHVRPNDKVMVAVLSQLFAPRTEWISDHAELRKAIEKVGNEATALGADAHRRSAEEEINYLIDIAAGTVGTDPTTVVPPTFDELLGVGRRYAEQALLETRNTASILGTVVTQLAIYPEKKAMIIVGEGLDTRPGWEIFERLESIKSGKVPSVGVQIALNGSAVPGQAPPPTSGAGQSPLIEASKYNAAAPLAALADTAYRKGVPIYAINPGTNQDAQSESGDLPDIGQQFARFASKNDGFKLVGDGSGGAAYVGMRAELALEDVAGDLGGYYSLGFRATGRPSKTTIRVKTRDAKHRVRTALAGAPASPSDAVMDAVTAHHVLAPETNDLEIAVEALDPVPAGEKQKVTVNVIIPIRNLTLSRQGGEVVGGFDVYLSISDGKGYFSPVNKQSHAIKWAAADVPDDETTMTYSIDVTLEPGASQISVGVVDQKSKKTGYERIEVQS